MRRSGQAGRVVWLGEVADGRRDVGFELFLGDVGERGGVDGFDEGDGAVLSERRS